PHLRRKVGGRHRPGGVADAGAGLQPDSVRAALAQLRLALLKRPTVLKNLRELHQYRALLWSLTVRELRARYRASVLGFLWTFLNPTLSMAVYALVFGVLLPQRVEKFP